MFLALFMALQAFVLALLQKPMNNWHGTNFLVLFLKIFLLNSITLQATLRTAIALDAYASQYGSDDWSALGVVGLGTLFTYAALFVIWLDTNHPNPGLIQEILGWLGGLFVGLLVGSGMLLGLIGLGLLWAKCRSSDYDDGGLWIMLGTVFPIAVVWLQAVVLRRLGRAT
ncbi:hypothetical protein [Nodosilinea nodulosa]|uniref:hypothetical protein n=1 Tax=Nodosilinea nodulosa TaxID=416001 RepID=UPI0012D789DA|nr:hypothetical protein [Nodosilinea nodulosa]